MKDRGGAFSYYLVLGKNKTSDGKLVVLFPSAQTGNKLFINSIKIAGDNKTYSLTDEGYFYRTIEEKA
ncbi:MAG: hypothetical protein IJT58_01050 [Synergistaceae bacterium]|nr:hypothetical protein [Synergistaceae bacterium]